jgi:uncharacterized membrane protein YjjB (DUF3815 family)
MTFKVSQEDVRIATINGGTMLLSFTNIEAALKIVLLLGSIVYTFYKIYELHETRKANK